MPSNLYLIMPDYLIYISCLFDLQPSKAWQIENYVYIIYKKITYIQKKVIHKYYKLIFIKILDKSQSRIPTLAQ